MVHRWITKLIVAVAALLVLFTTSLATPVSAHWPTPPPPPPPKWSCVDPGTDDAGTDRPSGQC